MINAGSSGRDDNIMRTMKRLLLPLLVFAIACPNTAPSPAPPKAATRSTQNAVAPDVAQRLAQLPRTVVEYDMSKLSESDRQVVAKLIEASKQIDEIFWRQVSEENPKWREQVAKNGGAAVDRVDANK